LTAPVWRFEELRARSRPTQQAWLLAFSPSLGGRTARPIARPYEARL
jgi:hypothetical protein